MQMICTPCFAAWSRNPRCFSILSRLISSIGASVGAALVHWISPHLTVRGIGCPRWCRKAGSRANRSEGFQLGFSYRRIVFIAFDGSTYLEGRVSDGLQETLIKSSSLCYRCIASFVVSCFLEKVFRNDMRTQNPDASGFCVPLLTLNQRFQRLPRGGELVLALRLIRTTTN